MKNVMTKISISKGLKLMFGIGLVFMAAYASSALAAETQTIGSIAENITKSFEGIGKLILGIAMVAGLGFVMAAIFKFKQHKDNPTQIPLGTPIALLAVGVALIFLPNIIKPAGQSLFGSEGKAGGFTGQGVGELPD